MNENICAQDKDSDTNISKHLSCKFSMRQKFRNEPEKGYIGKERKYYHKKSYQSQDRGSNKGSKKPKIYNPIHVTINW